MLISHKGIIFLKIPNAEEGQTIFLTVNWGTIKKKQWIDDAKF